MILVLLPACAFARDYYVATSGSDSNNGTFNSPYRTIQKAVSELDPGETCYIRGGTYHEAVNIGNLDGSSGNPIIFTNYNGEEVIIDGSESLSDLGGTNWTVHQGNIYKTTINTDIWQLWVDGRMAIVARWPNVTVGHPCDPIQLKADNVTPVDNSWWDLSGTWGHMASSWDAGGNLTNDTAYQDMGAENVSFAGGSIILNFHSESQFSRPILTHTAGTNDLTHTPVMNPHDKGSGHFLIEHKNALDMPGEWYYDMNTGEVWLWCEDGQTPQGRDVRGKTISYGMQMDGSSYVEIRGLKFFGCTITSLNGLHITIEDCTFSYPTWFRRMLGEHTYNGEPTEAKPEPMGEGAAFFRGDKNGTYFTMRNCIWEYSDGMIDMQNGYGDVVENNLFHHWSFTGMASMIFKMNSSENSIHTRNTFHTNGSKVCAKGTDVDVSYAHAYQFGYLQKDGVAFQAAGGNGAGGGSDGTVRQYIWHHDAYKGAVRWDGHNGINGTDHHLVSWNVPASMMIKGDFHKVIGNTCVNAWDYTENLIKLLTEDGAGGETMAANDEAYNNLADSMSSQRDGYVPLAGTSHSNNWNGYLHDRATGDTADKQVRDVANWDFRPAAGSDLIDAGIIYAPITDGYLGSAPDIGAYEDGDTHYWIPGFQDVIARTPVPLNGSTTAKPDCDLMWLAGREAISHDIYFGTTSGNLTFQGNQSLMNNIFDPNAGDLTAGQTYYWRIDTVTAAGTLTGNEWSFTVKEPLVIEYVTLNPIADTYVRNDKATTNYGESTQLSVATHTDGSQREGYMKFNINVPGTIVSATLNLYATGNSNSGSVQVYTMSDTSWDEYGMTYNNKPPIDGVLLDQQDVSSHSYQEFDVTGGFTGNGIISLGLDRALATSYRAVSSRENVNPPYLVIAYVPIDDPVPAPVANVAAVGGMRQISLTWDTHPEQDVVGYRVYRRQNPDDPFTQIQPGILTETSYIDASMLPHLIYQYVVKAEDAIGQLSLNSNITAASSTDPDINGSGKVDVSDFAVIAENWLSACIAPGWCQGTDLDQSGMVDLDDLMLLAQNWLE
jgi:hypothetical protein